MRKFIFTVSLLLLAAHCFAQNAIRVRLFDGQGKIGSVTLSGDVPVVAALPNGFVLSDSWTIQATASSMLVATESAAFELTGPVEFWVESADSQANLVTVKAGNIARRYRGKINVSLLPQDKGLLVVNSLPQEEYLYGVVPSEVPSGWPAEALKAQALLARTYSINHLNPKGNYDLVDSTNSQVYLGYDHEKPSTNRAVDETADLVVGYDSKPAPYVYYFSTCGGQTEDSGQIWSAKVPYLVPVSCSEQPAEDLSSEEAVQKYFATPLESYCARSSSSRWEVRLTAQDLKPLLPQGAELLDLKVTRRSPGGAAVEITLCTTQGEKKITGDTNVRRQLGKNGQTLRSSFFALEKVPAEDNATEYLLRGGGWGHRVGVCQWGMEGMARQGASASEILSHFLPGTEIITCQ